jgi:group I intron endonuclease
MITLKQTFKIEHIPGRNYGSLTKLEADILHPAEKTYTIYKLTCQSTKRCYVGCTSNLNVRLRCHLYNAKSPISSERHLPLPTAIREHGIEDFELEILDTSDDRDFAFNVLEIGYIEMHKAYELGYNSTKGGLGSGKGHQVSTEFRKMQRIRARKSGFKKNNRLGRKLRGRGWITNGVASRRLGLREKIPAGWRAGRTMVNRFKKAA